MGRAFLLVVSTVFALTIMVACTSEDTARPVTQPLAATPEPTTVSESPLAQPTPTSNAVPTATESPVESVPTTAPALPPPTIAFVQASPTSTRITTVEVSGSPKSAVSRPSCVERPNLTFTHFYTDMSQIKMINPTIVTSGNWLKNRQYHTMPADENNIAEPVPVYAPTDAVAIEITHYHATMHPRVGEPYVDSQFDVRFQASCDVKFWFDHISDLAEPFASLAAQEGSTDTRDAAVYVNIEVKAGDLIGWTTGTDPAHTWDFIVTDQRVTVQFANQERYEKMGELTSLLHAVCPYDYYSEEMRAEFVSKFAWWEGSTGSTRCGGQVDVPGALAGAWFQTPLVSGDTLYVPVDWGFVAKIEADGVMYSAGPDWGVRVRPGDPTFVDPALMTTENCYQHFRDNVSWMYVKLLSDMELALVHGEGLCPASMPSNHTTFYR